MFERFTDDARALVRRAPEDALRFGHRYVGTEHLLLAVVAADAPAGEVLREQGVTPELVKEQIVRQVGLGAGAGFFAGLDEKALAAIGIDLDAVRARIEASFSDDALYQVAQSMGSRPVRWHRRLRRRHAPRPGAVDAKGRYVPPKQRHLPFTPRARRMLERAFGEAQALKDTRIGVEHIALAALGMDSGLIPPILAALHAHPAPLRIAILNRYRQAS
jgi:ATP-dependent Clp protease ATP-binding subunit ClpA